jgi:hypothetical protein
VRRGSDRRHGGSKIRATPALSFYLEFGTFGSRPLRFHAQRWLFSTRPIWKPPSLSTTRRPSGKRRNQALGGLDPVVWEFSAPLALLSLRGEPRRVAPTADGSAVRSLFVDTTTALY